MADEARELTPEDALLEQLLQKIAKGNMNKEIARTLGLSTHTVRNYTAQIMKKMDVDDRTAAAVIAISRGWIKN